MTDNDAPKARTEIRETKVVSLGGDTYRVELALLDKPIEEQPEIAISISIPMQSKYPLPALVDLQCDALEHAVTLIREHTRAINKKIQETRK
jgi:hypothetical protein